MIRQYRIDRFNGLEVLVCEVYRKHLLTQAEHEAYLAWKEVQVKICPDSFASPADFRSDLNDWLDEHSEDKAPYYGLTEPIPVYDYLPAMVLRGVVVDNRIASLQVDYVASVISVEVVDAVNRFYGVLDSLHWRDMISHQIERYGSLFEPEDDSESGA